MVTNGPYKICSTVFIIAHLFGIGGFLGRIASLVCSDNLIGQIFMVRIVMIFQAVSLIEGLPAVRAQVRL